MIKTVFVVYKLRYTVEHVIDQPDNSYRSNLSGMYHKAEFWLQDMFDTYEEAESWIKVSLLFSEPHADNYTINKEYYNAPEPRRRT